MEPSQSSSQSTKSSGNSSARGSSGQANSGSVDDGAIANAPAKPTQQNDKGGVDRSGKEDTQGADPTEP